MIQSMSPENEFPLAVAGNLLNILTSTNRCVVKCFSCYVDFGHNCMMAI